ncbi:MULTISPECIES: phage tail protein [unclassified Roseateles]|uniref:phage tail protein n=1 Tax=unclassified Roseateles TaxID=2626991 RepID=UPI000701DE20|nr:MULTISPECIES: tail fiber protein [unclassified Roseateles]KQW46368.1 phage tail protein [Pelomonas sp. Root405]KRA73418.1 phage tail protein [Pelomonas sp. Root662]
MSDPFLGELKLMSFVYPPKGWALCNGQLLPIAQNQALFALLGTTYGGDGRVNFALPDLRGRAPLHHGAGVSLGDKAGQEAVTLTAGELPTHGHALTATNDLANASVPGGAVPAAKPRGGINRYGPAGSDSVMGSSSLASTGGNQPHPNMQPFTALSWVIALQGIFPSRN